MIPDIPNLMQNNEITDPQSHFSLLKKTNCIHFVCL